MKSLHSVLFFWCFSFYSAHAATPHTVASNAFYNDLVELNEVAYSIFDGNQHTVPNGWVQKEIPRELIYGGAHPYLFVHSSGLPVIVFKGSKIDLVHWEDGFIDLQLALKGELSENMRSAGDVALWVYKNYNDVFLTGHSKGGFEAEFAAGIVKHKAIVFDSPGLPRKTSEAFTAHGNAWQDYCLSVFAEMDPVVVGSLATGQLDFANAVIEIKQLGKQTTVLGFSNHNDYCNNLKTLSATDLAVIAAFLPTSIDSFANTKPSEKPYPRISLDPTIPTASSGVEIEPESFEPCLKVPESCLIELKASGFCFRATALQVIRTSAFFTLLEKGALDSVAGTWVLDEERLDVLINTYASFYNQLPLARLDGTTDNDPRLIAYYQKTDPVITAEELSSIKKATRERLRKQKIRIDASGSFILTIHPIEKDDDVTLSSLKSYRGLLDFDQQTGTIEITSISPMNKDDQGQFLPVLHADGARIVLTQPVPFVTKGSNLRRIATVLVPFKRVSASSEGGF